MEIETKETIELPKGPSENRNDSSADDPAHFEKLVADTHAEIKENAEAAQIKRGRGRPKGTGKNQRASEQDSKTAGENPSMDTRSAKEDRASMQETMKRVEPVVRDAIKTPFSIAAKRWKTPDLEVSESEAATPAHYLTKYLTLQLPELEKAGPKAFNLYAFLVTFLLLILRKIPVFAREKDVRAKTVSDSVPENPSPAKENTDVRAVVSTEIRGAGDYFSRGQ